MMKILKKNQDTNLLISLSNEFDALGSFQSFDGNILSEQNNIDVLYTGFTNNNIITIFFKGDQKQIDYLNQIKIDWGDGNETSVTNLNQVTHQYSVSGEYYVNCHVIMDFGEYLHNKKITVPLMNNDYHFDTVTLNNGITMTYDGEFETSTHSGGVNFKFAGIGSSRLEELRKYGTDEYINTTTGTNPDGTTWIRYVLDNLTYEDSSDGITTIIGFTGDFQDETYKDMMLTRNEHFLGFIDGPIIQSNVNIDRGRQSVVEQNLRLCEIDNIGELIVYGNGFFKIKK